MLIIDANALSAVFDPAHARHHDYRCILQFIKERGIITAGGKSYQRELRKVPKVMKLFLDLQRAGQLRTFPATEVDQEEERIRLIAPPPACDDQHLIALVCISKARVVATDDSRADKYLKDHTFYKGKTKRPSIYRSHKHRKLISKLPKLNNFK